MTEEDFRRLASSFPGAVESAHMGHPDFRREGKIFATLGTPGSGWGMVKLRPEEQSVVLAARPDVFTPAKGAWGRAGSTLVALAVAHERDVTAALDLAWANAAPMKRVGRARKAAGS
jgi:hypothetical protein